MSRYRIEDQRGLNYLTLTVVDWVDIFTRPVYKNIIIDSLRYCQEHKGLHVYGYVLMTNHLHLIVSAQGALGLSEVLRDFKKFTANQVLQAIQTGGESRKEWLLHRFAYRGNTNAGKREFQFWQQDNHPIELYSVPVIMQKLGYIHQNPVRSDIVAEAEHYIYSSASNYLNGKGVLECSLFEIPMTMVGYIWPTRL
jgi:putative transposase